MKKTIAIVVALMLVMSMVVYAVADVLSVEEINEKLKEYGSYLAGTWEVDSTYGRVLNSSAKFTIRENGDGLGINSLGEVYAVSFSGEAVGKILFTNNANTIYIIVRTNDYGATMQVPMYRKK